MALEVPAEAVPKAEGRSASIAWLRVLAIVGVVLIHVSGAVVVREDLQGTPVYTVAALMNGATRFCVPLFVVVSGALVLRPSSMSGGLGAFYRKRLSRLVPALVAWHVIYVLFRRVVRHEHFGLDDLLVQTLGGRVYTALYFFWLILGLYLVAPFLWKAVADLSLRQRVIIALVLVSLTCVWQSTLGVFAWQGAGSSPGAQTIWTLWLPYVGFFLLGSALRDVEPTLRTGLLGLGLYAVGAGVTTWQVLGQPPAPFHVLAPFGYWSWFVAMATIGLWLAGRWFWRAGTWASRGSVGRAADVLGSLTLGVFGIHLIVLYFAQRWLTPGLASGSIRVPGLLALTAFVLVVSWAAAYAMSKVPGLRRIV